MARPVAICHHHWPVNPSMDRLVCHVTWTDVWIDLRRFSGRWHGCEGHGWAVQKCRAGTAIVPRPQIMVAAQGSQRFLRSFQHWTWCFKMNRIDRLSLIDRQQSNITVVDCVFETANWGTLLEINDYHHKSNLMIGHVDLLPCTIKTHETLPLRKSA